MSVDASAGAGSRSDAIATAFWAMIGALACWSLRGFEPNLLEEGIVVHIAQRLAEGEHLYQDVLIFTGPLPYELLALLFRVFGEEIAVARAAIAVTHGLATGATFWIARRAAAGSLSHAAAAMTAAAPLVLFPLFSIFFYTTLAFHLSLAAVAAAVAGISSRRAAFAAGALVAAVALCKQTVGASLAVTLGIALVFSVEGRERLRCVIAYSAGGLCVALLTLAGFAVTGGLDDLFFALVTLPTSFDEIYTSPYPNLWPPGELAPEIRASETFYFPYFLVLIEGLFVERKWWMLLLTQVLFAVPLAAILGAVLRPLLSRVPRAVWFHLALLVAWMSNLFPRTDWGHLVHVLPLAMTQLLLLGSTSGAPSRGRRALVGGVATLAIAVAAGGVWWSNALIRREADPNTFGERVPLRPVSLGLRGEPVTRVIRYLEERVEPGEAIFVARAEPLLYFATGTTNPTPYLGVIPGMQEEQQDVILEALERVRFVVMSDVDQPAMTYYRDVLPRVQAHLERFYHIPRSLLGGQVHWLVVLEKGRDRGPTAIDLVERSSSATAWTRNAEGIEAEADRFTDVLPTKYNRRPVGFYLDEGGGGLDYRLRIPEEPSVFQADVGLWVVSGAKDIYVHPERVRMRVSIDAGDGFKPLVSLPAMGPGSDFRRWNSMQAELSRFAGQDVTLRLELQPTDEPTIPRSIGYYASPRIALTPARGRP